MKKATIVAFDKFTDIDIFLAWDLLNRVRLRDKDFEVKIVGTSAKHRSVCGIDLDMHGQIEECNDADLVFFSSGPGTRALYKDPAYLSRFQLDPNQQLICSMCSGALILAAMGHLTGITATTYPTAVEALRALGVEVVEDQHLVVHGNIATAAGCLAAVDLVGWAVEKLYNHKVKEDVINSVLPVGQGQACIY
ncbi:ThiJ/PfpI family protein [Fulvivirga imtechensis AK7]|uniref:ThiJ/PfpI family protein n=1 Tax=Fulvivirga imtechensis AK7 TaxID=1237149 RepID=L8JYP8_9BACT|nr:DJ-1/PfpI family protein [Fulvivirga imtechensis]ELR72749.1 ThiJ/PfpI family protein [Fulvivirga imtechensis AK7]